MSSDLYHNLPSKKKLQSALKLANINEVPRISRLVVNVGVGKVDKEPRERLVKMLGEAIGQYLAPVQAKKSVAGFKVRAGQVVAYRATLRGRRAWQFLNELVNVVLPRTRDFRGLKLRAIQNGCLNIGIRDITVFPEIRPDQLTGPAGIQITVVTTAKDRQLTEAYLRLLNFPLEKVEKQNG